MLKINIIVILCCLFCTSCLNAPYSATPDLVLDESSLSTSLSPVATATVQQLSFVNGTTIAMEPYQSKQLYLTVTMSDGRTFHGITRELSSVITSEATDVIWYSNDTSIVGISSSGRLIGRQSGTTTVIATVLNQSAVITVTVAPSASQDEISDQPSSDDTGNLENEEQEAENTDEADDEQAPPEVVEADTLNNLQITTNDTLWEVGDTVTLRCSLDFANSGLIQNVSSIFYLGSELQNVSWTSSDNAVVSINQGKASFVGYGISLITASYQDQSDQIEVVVKMKSEAPDDASDSFLNEGDVLTDNFGPNSGYGYADFPDIVYGPPANDLVSFGYGGELTIELANYLIVDGIGPDFTVFENPFGGWEECASIAVSEDGTAYQTFDCDQYDADGDGEYQGCAGKSVVNLGLADADYLDPDVSGGDVFDLEDLEEPMSTVRFVRITDIGLCGSTADVPSSTSAGFDMDALAIVQGNNE
ncbi:MAG: Cell surface protein [uncultured bacterium]|nr:MAG: Cell surface protein [uncultured bacterium]